MRDNFHLIYVHIPKAAGSTVENILYRLYGRQSIFRISSEAAERKKDIDLLKALPDDQKRKIIVLTGVIDFGLHQYLPYPAKYFTILRHPIQRVISHYFFVKNTPSHRLYQELNAKQLSLVDYLDWYPTREMDNAMARQISGKDLDWPAGQSGFCNEHDYDRALHNISEEFFLAGTLDRFDETLLLLKHLLDWPFPTYTQKNVNKIKKPAIPREAVRAIEEHNKWDIKLYQHVKQEFDELLKAQVGSFQAELRLFQFLSRFSTRFPELYWSLEKRTLKNERQVLI